MERGYVKLWRKVLDSGILSNGDASHLFLYLLVKASWRKHNLIVGKQNVELLPGQAVFGRVKAASDLNMSEWRIRTALVLLEKMGVISAPKTTSKFSVVSFVNWGLYQTDTSENHQQVAPIATSKPPANHHKQEVKEGKEEKPIVAYSDEVVALSHRLYAKINARNPKFKKPNMAVWNGHIDKLIRLDKRRIEDVSDVIDWCQEDKFWQNNILSADKLRKQFDQLYMKMETPKEKRVDPAFV